MAQVVIWLHSPLAHALYLGWMAAAGTDIKVLVSTGQVRGWAALKDFDWSMASFRWLVGIGSAAVGYIGLGAVGL